MEKSKRIAIGGWLNNVLSIATRGWFGAPSVPPVPIQLDTLLGSFQLATFLEVFQFQSGFDFQLETAMDTFELNTGVGVFQFETRVDQW